MLPGGDEFAAGKKVYADQNCAKCHKLGDTGGGRGGKGGGPNLTNLGAEPDNTTDWIAAHIRNAKTHNPRSRMPAFGADKLNDADLALLVQYLASLK
jgi:mono/diheme cytochrome c family protein